MIYLKITWDEIIELIKKKYGICNIRLMKGNDFDRADSEIIEYPEYVEGIKEE